MVKTIPILTTKLYKMRKFFYRIKYRKIRKYNECHGITFISQNCVGGVIYDLYSMRFNSPFINLYINADDFVKIVENLRYYLSLEPHLKCEQPYLLCSLGDIELHCLHYVSFDDFIEKWKRRVKRVNYNNLIILWTDRDGFTNNHYQIFDKWEERKFLFSSKKISKDGIVFLKQFKNDEQVGTITDFSNFLGVKYFEKINFGKYLTQSFISKKE